LCLFLPIFKAAEPLRFLSMAHGFIWEASFNQFISSGFNVLEFCESVIPLCFLLSDFTDVMHGTNTAVYLQLLCQSEWLHWGHTDWGHSGICPDTLREVPLHCDVGHSRNEWHTLTSPHGRWTAILTVGIQMYAGAHIVCELMVTSYKHMCGVCWKT
jgi:hypothetical protein